MKILQPMVKNRLTTIREWLHNNALDGLLISSRENNRYLSGFTGTESWLLITPDQALILIDFRYLEQAAIQCPDFSKIDYTSDRIGKLVESLKDHNCLNLGIEEDDLKWGFCQQLLKTMPDLALKPAQSKLNEWRSVKDDIEVAQICRAIEIAETALQEILPAIRPGQSEIEIAAKLEYSMRLSGASGPSFNTIVASGPRSALPHGVASERIIEAGDAVVFDFGCIWQGYCSDMTRTFFVGEPNDLQRKIYSIVLDAQIKAAAALKAGISGQDGDNVARKIITDAGYGECFGHGLGHGVGLAVHEAPRLSQSYPWMLVPNQIVTVEPGIYLPGQFGVRIEDMLLLQEGGAINLNHFNKDLLVLPA